MEGLNYYLIIIKLPIRRIIGRIERILSARISVGAIFTLFVNILKNLRGYLIKNPPIVKFKFRKNDFLSNSLEMSLKNQCFLHFCPKYFFDY